MKIMATIVFDSEDQQELICGKLYEHDLKFGEQKGGIAFSGNLSYEECLEIVRIIDGIPTNCKIISLNGGKHDEKS